MALGVCREVGGMAAGTPEAVCVAGGWWPAEGDARAVGTEATDGVWSGEMEATVPRWMEAVGMWAVRDAGAGEALARMLEAPGAVKIAAGAARWARKEVAAWPQAWLLAMGQEWGCCHQPAWGRWVALPALARQ